MCSSYSLEIMPRTFPENADWWPRRNGTDSDRPTKSTLESSELSNQSNGDSIVVVVVVDDDDNGGSPSVITRFGFTKYRCYVGSTPSLDIKLTSCVRRLSENHCWLDSTLVVHLCNIFTTYIYWYRRWHCVQTVVVVVCVPKDRADGGS